MINISKYEKASAFEVGAWMIDNIPELTEYQKQKISEYDYEMIANAPFVFIKPKQEKSVSFLMRLTLPLFMITTVLLIIGLPINYMIRGRWYYGFKINSFYECWQYKLKIE